MKNKMKRIYSKSRKTAFILVLTMFLSFISVASADTTQEVTVTFAYYGPIWDINHDGVDNYLDVSSMVSHYRQTGSPPHWIRDDCAGSGGPDGIVNYLDISLLVSHYREVWLVP